NIFYVNQIMKFGKFFAVLQAHPNDAGKTVVTAFVALAIKASVLDQKRSFENVPVLRNLVPARVLMGQSSAALNDSPAYHRNLEIDQNEQQCVITSAQLRLCCKSRKLQGSEFFAKTRLGN